MQPIKKVTSALLVLAFTLQHSAGVNGQGQISSPNQNDPWWKSGKETLKQRLAVIQNKHNAKNVILFIGDGMGVSTVTAARIFDGQSRGELGEENQLSFESFPNLALIKTYNVDAQVPDSAATASAMNTGVKTRFTQVGTWGNQAQDDCFGPNNNFPSSIAEISESKGLSTGIVTTDKVTYATPAAVYAHSFSRHWEDDSTLPEAFRARGCQDIAQQLVNFPYGDGLDVILGGGLESLLPKGEGGRRLDKQNLVETWKQQNPDGLFTTSAKEFRNINTENTTKLFGVFAARHLSYSIDKNLSEEPTLAEMTVRAIDLLSSNAKGYFLMVENGHIDHGHHKNNAYRALSDTQAFALAIEKALAKVNLEDTLVLVTADHSHPLTMVGYPKRGNPILGLIAPVGMKGGVEIANGLAVDNQNQPYTTLGYRVGPNTLSATNTDAKIKSTDPDYHQKSAVSMDSGFHGGEDVALYAIGPQSHLVGGVLEQHVIFHIISQAFGWNDKK